MEVDRVAEGAEISAVRIEHMGYTAADVRQLLEDLQSRFKPKPFTGECPYVGLEAFGEQDAGRFFGRERLVAELVALVKTARFVTVAGPSGSGKSSLVRAGLIPALGEESERDWRAVTLRPGRAPLEALGRAVAQLAAQLAPEDDLRQKGVEDASILARWVEVVLGDDPKRRALVVVDQFEELFTQVSEGDEALRAAFLEQLVYAATLEKGRAVVLITLRSDFIANCAAYPRVNALLNQGFRQVGPMSPDELVSAIVRPALEVGLKLDPELVEQVVADVGDEPGALPLMQFALKDLFEYEMGKGGVEALTLDGYLARGGLRKALERHADQAFQNLSAREQELAQSVFRGLIVPGRGHQDTRRTALFTELIPQGVKPEEVEAVIYKLADARLVTTEDREEIPGAERSATLAHERLLEAWPWLQHLVDENREAIQLSNQVADDAARWVAAEHDSSYLYSGARLARTEEWLANDRLTLSQAGREFLDASVAARDEARLARRRRVQITIAALAAAVVIFAVLAG
ncbi:MAG: ATP-binding protein, partial [Gammaproteobacteria bacterium]